MSPLLVSLQQVRKIENFGRNLKEATIKMHSTLKTVSQVYDAFFAQDILMALYLLGPRRST